MNSSQSPESPRQHHMETAESIRKKLSPLKITPNQDHQSVVTINENSENSTLQQPNPNSSPPDDALIQPFQEVTVLHENEVTFDEEGLDEANCVTSLNSGQQQFTNNNNNAASAHQIPPPPPPPPMMPPLTPPLPYPSPNTIIFIEFHNIHGMQILFHTKSHPQLDVPLTCLSDNYSLFLIPKPDLSNHIISFIAGTEGDWLFIGCPQFIENLRYERNALVWNIVMGFYLGPSQPTSAGTPSPGISLTQQQFAAESHHHASATHEHDIHFQRNARHGDQPSDDLGNSPNSNENVFTGGSYQQPYTYTSQEYNYVNHNGSSFTSRHHELGVSEDHQQHFHLHHNSCCARSDGGMQLVDLYAPVLRKIAHSFRQMENEKQLISKHKTEIDRILPLLLSQLHQRGEFSISVFRDDPSPYLLNGKVMYCNQFDSPPEVQPWFVPVPKLDLNELLASDWDLTIQKIIPFIDSVRFVKEIAKCSNVHMRLVQRALRHLLFFDAITLIDVFQYSNIYVIASRQKLSELFYNRDMQEECVNYVSNIPSNTVEINDLLSLYSRFKFGRPLKVVLSKCDISNMIDHKSLVTYGLLRKFLVRVHEYPILRQDFDISLYESDLQQTNSKFSLKDLIPYLNGNHCIDEICVLFEISRRDIMDLLNIIDGEYSIVRY